MDCPHPGKKKHPNRAYAEHSIGKAWRTGRRKPLPLRAYKCRCGKWHTTSKPMRKQYAIELH